MLSRKELVLISIIESIYILYFLCFFKTKISLDKGYLINKLSKVGIYSKSIEHPVHKSPYPVSMICPFGHFISIPIVNYLVVRFCIPVKIRTINIFSIIVVSLIFIGSFMNLNAVIYLLPFVLFDLLLNIYLLKDKIKN